MTELPVEELPISLLRDEIGQAVRDHQVVIVAGETGSGKSTQLPQICLDIGRGRSGRIAHTQPRRIAARSIAARIAAELGERVGGLVGYAVRFDDEVGPDTRVKLVTDGLLLAEIQRDRLLSAYDTVIVDEAHERSLNIDFLLGYLTSLLPRRPDLKVIVTSATIDTQRFADHFEDNGIAAPVIEVTGRTHPVELRYRPIEEGGQPEAIAAAVGELRRTEPGDVLVFCSGEREIREAIEAIDELGLTDTDVVPLFARLSNADQQRIFAPHQRRRIVVSTNVAETSLTVPGIRSVIDAGTARISRYNRRTKVQRLPIESISQASANQRAGRCGRVAPGVCIRLYSEDDFEARPEFTEPEIQRTNLASVILQMASLGLGEIGDFPFVEPPESRNIADGVALLEELDAVDPDEKGTNRWLTPIGRTLARLPIDPRLGRMVVEADRNGCVREVSVIAAGLSIQDPRDRPTDSREAAAAAHAEFDDPRSDFLSFLKLWDELELRRRTLSRNQFRRMCRKQFLNFNRVREWQDIERQLREVNKSLGYHHATRPQLDPSDDAVAQRIHQSLLSGLLSHIGMRDHPKERGGRANSKRAGRSGRPPLPEFIGARSARFAVVPGSSQRRTKSQWIMAAELVETNRLWGRVVAPIEVRWIEELSEHLASYRYEDPQWSRERGTATTIERATLYGLPVVAGRTINHRNVDVAEARDLFIHHALIEGDLETTLALEHHAFVEHNRAILAEVAALEARARRHSLIDEQAALFRFYGERVGPDVTSIGHFNRWWKRAGEASPELLHLSIADVVDVSTLEIDSDDFPDRWRVGDAELVVSYEFDPTSPIDGVMVDVPLAILNQLDGGLFEWNVPGFRAELFDALIRSLPKDLRKQFVPVPQTVDALTAALRQGVDPTKDGLIDAVRRELGRLGGVHIAASDFRLDRVPGHLRPTFRVVDDDGGMLGAGKSLDSLRARMDRELRSSLETGDDEITTVGLTAWPREQLPELPTIVERSVPSVSGTHRTRAFPAFVDEDESVAVRLLPTEQEQSEAMWAGTRRLLRFATGAPVRTLDRLLDNESKLLIAGSSLQSRVGWYDDIITGSLDDLMRRADAPVWTAVHFDELVEFARGELPDSLATVSRHAVEIIRAESDAVAALEERSAVVAFADAVDDGRAHLHRLVYPGVVAGVGAQRLMDVARYVRGIHVRMAGLAESVGRDRDRMNEIRSVERDYRRMVGREGMTAELEDIGWLLEELRVSLFAQRLGVNERVSVKRIRRAIEAASHI